MNLLFDLDGTLIDPLPGIARSIQHAVISLGLTPPEIDELRRFIGPPLRASLADLVGTTDRDTIAKAVAHYRDRFAKIGMFENEVYPEVPDVLRYFATTGHAMWVVTSKPHVYANAIVDHFDLRRFFRAVYGSELDGRLVEKSDLIRVVLEREGLSRSDTWMIGDRAADILAGRQHGLRTAGVLWGYGLENEVSDARPDLLARTLSDLRAITSVA